MPLLPLEVLQVIRSIARTLDAAEWVNTKFLRLTGDEI
jgi:hypothetical protein